VVAGKHASARARAPEVPRPLAHLAPLVLYRVGAEVARRCPPSVGEPAARAIGRVMAVASPRRRAQVARNLQRVSQGRIRGPALRRAVADTFDSYGRYWWELFRLEADLARDDFDRRLGGEGAETLGAAVTAGDGVILALPHLGGWDYGGAWLARRGTPPVAVVEPLEPPQLFDWFADVRRAVGMEIVALGPEAGPALLRALSAGGIVALLCDRDLTGNGVTVEFLDEETTVPAGPALLALRTGAALLPAAVYFAPGGGHHVVVKPPVPAERRGRLRDDVQRVSQDLAHGLEELIRAAPDQWHLMQPNWPSDLDGHANGRS
jgi:phosphatidylinositol dimannoside acyltransferase